jgi:hypothetical protein
MHFTKGNTDKVCNARFINVAAQSNGDLITIVQSNGDFITTIPSNGDFVTTQSNVTSSLNCNSSCS